VSIEIEGVHTEQLGAENQPWDRLVHERVRAALRAAAPSASSLPYALEARWYVGPARYRRDLDNFRINPVLDSLTAEAFWPDDNVRYVRRLLTEVELVASPSEERLVVTVYTLE
jgi:hypothetical protein